MASIFMRITAPLGAALTDIFSGGLSAAVETLDSRLASSTQYDLTSSVITDYANSLAGQGNDFHAKMKETARGLEQKRFGTFKSNPI